LDIQDHHSKMMTSTLPADDSEERLIEICEILAAGLMRLETRKSSGISAETGESPLHFMPDQSGHANPVSPEVTA
jgi:hypothetical protein